MTGAQQEKGRALVAPAGTCCRWWVPCVLFGFSLESITNSKHDRNIAPKDSKALQALPRLSLLVAVAPEMVMVKCNFFRGKKNSREWFNVGAIPTEPEQGTVLSCYFFKGVFGNTMAEVTVEMILVSNSLNCNNSKMSGFLLAFVSTCTC